MFTTLHVDGPVGIEREVMREAGHCCSRLCETVGAATDRFLPAPRIYCACHCDRCVFARAVSESYSRPHAPVMPRRREVMRAVASYLAACALAGEAPHAARAVALAVRSCVRPW